MRYALVMFDAHVTAATPLSLYPLIVERREREREGKRSRGRALTGALAEGR